MLSHELLLINAPRLADQQRLTSISYVKTLDAVWRTCQEQWTIGMDGERDRENQGIHVFPKSIRTFGNANNLVLDLNFARLINFHMAGCDTRSIFMKCKTALNSKFTFSQNGCRTKIRDSSFSYHLLIADRRRDGFMSFSNRSRPQISLFRI